MPIGKGYPGTREGSMREFLQSPPARVIPRMAGEFGAPEIGWCIQQLDQDRAMVFVRSERVVVETEAFLHFASLEMSKRQVPAQMAAKGAVPWIVVEPGTKERDSGVGLTILIMENA